MAAFQGDTPCKNATLSLVGTGVQTQDAEFEMLAAPDSYQYAVTLLPRSFIKTSLARNLPISWETQTGNMYRFQKRVTSVSVHALLAVALAGLLTFGAVGFARAQDTSARQTPSANQTPSATQTPSGTQPVASPQASVENQAGGSADTAAAVPSSQSSEPTGPVEPVDAAIASETTDDGSAPAPDVSEAPAVSVPVAFDPAQVIERARDLAKQPFENPHRDLPDALANLSAENYAKIRFKAERAFFSQANSGFALDLYHPGNMYDVPVAINLVRDGQVQAVPYSAGLFDFGETGLSASDFSTQGYAGFRLRYPLGDVAASDELATFLGASYFRIQGRDQVAGQMARGLTIDLAGPSGEEIPVFREFWIVAPKQGERTITVFALLDSTRVTGAYRFDIHPGDNSKVDVSSTLFFRDRVEKIGLAPLNSMFLYGEQKRRRFEDYRGEVHSSDGLLINNGKNEWLWRPLDNPANLQISSFLDENPRGFGLLQRDRNFDHYQDLDTRFDQQPGYWVTPKGNWGKGHVELVEIPSPSESNDNIVVFWVPQNKPEAGTELTFDYQIAATRDGRDLHQLSQATDTRIMNIQSDGDEAQATTRFLLNFAGDELEYYLADLDNLKANISASNAEIRNVRILKDPENGGVRVIFDLTGTGDAQSSNLRAFLQYGDRVLSETWTMPWVF